MEQDVGRPGPRIRAAAQTLMTLDESPGERRDAAHALLSALSDCTGLDADAPSPADQEESDLPSGKAISPQGAARCVPDFVRTGCFLKGVCAAVEAARHKFPGETIRVLYAGCGPFAVLALPIAHRWTAEEVRFTLVDIHNRSLETARLVAEELGVLDRIAAFLRADAATLRCSEDDRPHVVVTETMQRALEKEPQVAISENLAAQLVPGGFLVPEEIWLQLTFINPGKEFAEEGCDTERERLDVGCAMRLDRAGSRCHELIWPIPVPTGLSPVIRTRIRVFGDILLDDRESGLTVPTILESHAEDPETWPGPGDRLIFSYRRAPTPKLTFRVGP